MERHTDMEAYNRPKKMFSAKDFPEIVRLFKEAGADDGKGLDKQEFCEVMKKLYSSVSEDELTMLHAQIDSGCYGTVNLDQLLAFRLNKIKAHEAMDYLHYPYPKSFQRVPVDCQVPTIGMVFLPFKEDTKKHYSADFRGVIRPYKQGRYLSLTSNGTLWIWTDKFEISSKLSLWQREYTVPFSHVKKIFVVDMVYIKELRQLVVSNFTRELFFYDCRLLPSHIKMIHSLVVEGGKVSAMNYWSDGTKAVFSIGDIAGFLTVFISQQVEKNDLFCKEAFEKVSLQKYPTVCVSTLLNQNSSDFQCIKVSIFNDACSQIRYFPSLHSVAACGKSFKRMAVITLPHTSVSNVTTDVFVSDGVYDFFTCVEYAPAAKQLVTGGTDGSLRLWIPNHTICIETLKAHDKPITNLMYNAKDQILISLSEDKNLRVWSEIGWLCRQIIQVENIGQSPITSMCYNIHNNEIVLANSDITKCLGKGTDVFHESLTSHEKPLCCALYHSFFKRVISCCQNGVVTVWDILTGNAVMQFKVIPDNTNGRTFMSFDGQQQSLITVFKDGKVRWWNFSNGKKLSVHPVTVQKYVTAIVCIKDRVFVSGRDSKVIFDLDIEGIENRFLKHSYLNDISSMDVHGERLITTTSSGNIIIWDHDNGNVFCWIDASVSPRTRMAGENTQGLRGIIPVRKNRSTCKGITKNNVTIGSLAICLKTREAKADTATLLTSADGYIHAWSVVCTGGLLGKFRAVKDDAAVITTMSSDVNEHILLTGDSTGWICLWDIQRFGFKRQAGNGPFEDRSGWRVSLCPPPLLESWQSHPTAVVSVECDPACSNIITAGLDCNVCRWTNKGMCIGVFGKEDMQLCPEDSDQEQEDSEFHFQKSCNSPVPEFESIKVYKYSTGVLLAKCHEAKLIRSELDKEIDRELIKYVQPVQKTSRRKRVTHLGQGSALAVSPDSTKYGRVLETNILEDDVLIPCPPESLPDRQGSDRIPPHLYKPYTQHKTYFKPHPP